MVSAARAFAKEPPRRPLDSLDAIVEDFQWRYVERKKTDQVIAYCREAPDLRTAIARAVEARDAAGKHHNHQSKVDITARRLLGGRMWTRRTKIRSFTDFDTLHDFIDQIKPYGIGPVTVYDVAVRVGAYLDLEPTSVYMHAGVRQGMIALAEAMPVPVDPEWSRWTRVKVMAFPPPLNGMKADDVEDILCTYREVFIEWANA